MSHGAHLANVFSESPFGFLSRLLAMCEGWDEDHGRGCVGLDIHLKGLRDCLWGNAVTLGRPHRLLLAAVSILEEVVRRLGSDVVRQGAGVCRVSAFGNPSSMVKRFPLVCAQKSVKSNPTGGAGKITDPSGCC